MAIQSSFNIDAVGIFPKMPQKAQNSLRNLMDFVFQEYIYEETLISSPSTQKKGESPDLRTHEDNREEEKAPFEITPAILPSRIENSVPKESIEEDVFLPEIFDPNQALTMKQLDLALGENLVAQEAEETISPPQLPQGEAIHKKESLVFEFEAAPSENDGVNLAQKISFSKDKITVATPEISQEASKNSPPDGLQKLFQHSEEDNQNLKSFFENMTEPPPVISSFQASVQKIDITPAANTIPNITTQILDQVPQELFSTQGSHQLKIQLYPEELGEVTIDLKISDRKEIQAIFSTASSGTLDLLRQDASQLLQALKKEGFEVGAENFQFTSDEGKQRDPKMPPPALFSQKEINIHSSERQRRQTLYLKLAENNLIDIRVH